MGNGNFHVTPTSVDEHFPYGAVRTSSGRISAATPRGKVPVASPFTTQELIKLDDTIQWATERVSVRFSVYIGDFRGDAITHSSQVFAHAPEPENGCLIAVSPNSSDFVVLSGKQVAHKITDTVAQIGVSAGISAIKEGDLIDAIIAAIRSIVSVIKDL